MPDIKGTALLPKGAANGFLILADELAKEPLKPRAAIVIFNAKRGNLDYDQEADNTITVRVLRVARLLPQDLAAAEVMVRRSVEFDSGQTTLDLELEDEIRKTFETMADPANPDDPEDEGKGKGRKGKQ